MAKRYYLKYRGKVGGRKTWSIHDRRLENMIAVLIVIGLWYFLIYRPKRKREDEMLGLNQ